MNMNKHKHAHSNAINIHSDSFFRSIVDQWNAFRVMRRLFDALTSSQSQSEYVGKNVKVGKYSITIESVIAEGGFAIVYCAKINESKGGKCALKRMFVNDEDQLAVCQREIRLMKELNGHKNIVRYMAHMIKKQPTGTIISISTVISDLSFRCLWNSFADRILQSWSRSRSYEQETQFWFQWKRNSSHFLWCLPRLIGFIFLSFWFLVDHPNRS